MITNFLIILFILDILFNNNILILLGTQNKQITPNHLQRLTPKIVCDSNKVTVSTILYRYN